MQSAILLPIRIATKVQSPESEGPVHASAGERQTLMFSATFPKDIQQLAADFMSNYLFLAVGRVGSSTNLIIQQFEEVEPGEKQKLLVRLVRAVPVSWLTTLS
jgi:ATP-dependent RNA helicase DDX3X